MQKKIGISLQKDGQNSQQTADFLQDEKERIRKECLEKIDLSGDLTDTDVLAVIDRCMDRTEFTLSERLSLRRLVFHSLRGLDVLEELLADDEITEIMLNGPDRIFIEKEGRIHLTNLRFASEERLINVIQQICADTNRMVNESRPIVDVILPEGSRVNVVLKGISCDGAAVTIRKFPARMMDMRSLIERSSLDEKTAGFLELLVKAGYNIFISGGTGAGKTTFLNALTEYIPRQERVITIEDSAELKIIGIENLIRLQTRNANVEGQNRITIRDLIRSSLRMRPDRIIVGEVRDEAAIDMLQAMNTGHDGSLSTGHANSASEMLLRLETMVLSGQDLPLRAVRQQIASGVDILVHLERLRDRTRRVVEIREVTGMRDGEVETQLLYQFEEVPEESPGVEERSGGRPGMVRGTLRKMRDLSNVKKLERAGLFRIYQEQYMV